MKEHFARPIKRNRLLDAAIDIIVPFHGQYEKVHKLVDSIWLGLKSNPYNICLVDDCSPNAEYIKSYARSPRVTTIRLDTQMGFGAALQAGYIATSNPFVAFVHSDCVMEDHSCFQHLSNYLLDTGVGMVAARSDNPGEGADQRLRSKRTELGKDIVLEEGTLPLYCVLMRRTLFQKIGGFVRPYPFGYYEDEELAYRMRLFGIPQAISGKAWVRHRAGSTFTALAKEGKETLLRETIEKNYHQCQQDISSLNAKHH